MNRKIVSNIIILSILISFMLLLPVKADRLINMDFVEADIVQVLKLLAIENGYDVVIDQAVVGNVTSSLKNVSIDKALSVITRLNGFDYRIVGKTIFVAPPDKLAAIISEIAVPVGEAVTQVIHLQYAKPSDIIGLVQSNIKGVTLNPADNVNGIIARGSLGTIKRVKNLVGKLDVPKVYDPEQKIDTCVIKLSYAKVKDIETYFKELLPDVDYQIDERLNAFVIQSSSEVINQCKDVLSQIDIPLDQVVMDVKVISMTKNGTKTLGSVLTGTTTSSSSITTQLVENADTATQTVPNYMDLPITYFSRTPIQINMILTALIAKNEAEVLATPSIATLDGKEGMVEATRKYRYVNYDSRSGSYTVQDVDVGVTLKVTPKITPDGYVMVTVEPKVSDFLGLIQQRFPNTLERTCKVNLRVKDGETLVLAGLIREFESKNKQKIPLLGDLPIVGEIFKGTQHQKVDDELVIMITPKILKKI